MKKMPPSEKMPPNGSNGNGSGRSRMNGRADELSHGERIAQLEVLIQNCATKEDLERLRGELKTEMAELRGEMAELRSEMKTEMAALKSELKAEMHANSVSNLKWMLGIMLPFFTLLMTVFKFL